MLGEVNQTKNEYKYYVSANFYRKILGLFMKHLSTTLNYENLYATLSSGRLFVSATLSGLETLKYSPFHGVCFFDKIFSFFNSVTFLVSEIVQKAWLYLLVVKFCFIYILDIIKYENYFFIPEIYYDHSFYSYEFIYLFLLKKLIKFVGFMAPAVEG